MSRMWRAPAGLLDGALLHHRHARGDADHDARAKDNTASDHLLDKKAHHALGNVIVCDNAVTQRPDRNNIAGRTPDHLPRLLTNRQHLIRVAIHRDHRGFLENNPLALDKNEHIRRTKVNSDIHRHPEHIWKAS